MPKGLTVVIFEQNIFFEQNIIFKVDFHLVHLTKKSSTKGKGRVVQWSDWSKLIKHNEIMGEKGGF